MKFPWHQPGHGMDVKVNPVAGNPVPRSLEAGQAQQEGLAIKLRGSGIECS